VGAPTRCTSFTVVRELAQARRRYAVNAFWGGLMPGPTTTRTKLSARQFSEHSTEEVFEPYAALSWWCCENLAAKSSGPSSGRTALMLLRKSKQARSCGSQ
jgi:hypothetical protein